MFEFVGRCFNVDIWGLCSKKNPTYIDFGKEDRQGKMVNNDPYNDPAWDADVDALNEMEYNLVAEQPKGIKLELHDPETLESPRNQFDEKTEDPGDTKSDTAAEAKSLDVTNHNELSDLISGEDSVGGNDSDNS